MNRARNYRRLLTALRRAIRRDDPFTERQRAVLGLLVMELLADRDGMTSALAASVALEMTAANMRDEREPFRALSR